MLHVVYDNTSIPGTEEEFQQLRELDALKPGYVSIITDGACSGNTGPAGFAGCLLKPDGDTVRIRFFEGKLKGESTNNQAELSGILEGLKQLTTRQKLILITDSEYCEGVLSKNWKRKANLEIIEEIEHAFKDKAETILWRRVPGHGDCLLMKTIDRLAVQQAGSKGKH